MIKINVNKRKIIEFDVNVKGIDPNALHGRLSLFYENVIYSFPTTMEDGTVRVEIPALDEIIKEDIPDKYQAKLRLEIVGNDTFMQPWSGSAYLEHPVKVEAVMRNVKGIMEDEQKRATVKVDNIREEEVEEKKTDESCGKEHSIPKEKKKPVKKKKSSKLVKVLTRRNEEEEKECPEGKQWCPIQKKCVTPARKGLGEELAKALLLKKEEDD